MPCQLEAPTALIQVFGDNRADQDRNWSRHVITPILPSTGN